MGRSGTSGSHAQLLGAVARGLYFFQGLLEIILRVLPFERLGDLIVESLKLEYGSFKAFKAEGLDLPPQGVKKVFFRSDSAGYVQELLVYRAEGKNRRFGVIEFAVGADMTQVLKKAIAEPETEWKRLFRMVDGRPVDAGQEYPEVCSVPSWVGQKEHGPEYRFLAIREPLRSDNSGKKSKQATLPFPTMDFGPVRYKVTGLATNRTIAGDDLIWRRRERCGKSEEAHSVMKADLAGGEVPFKPVWGQCCLAAYHDPGVQCQRGHEASGAGGRVGEQTPESHSI
jgi:hypothetical protein